MPLGSVIVGTVGSAESRAQMVKTAVMSLQVQSYGHLPATGLGRLRQDCGSGGGGGADARGSLRACEDAGP